MGSVGDGTPAFAKELVGRLGPTSDGKNGRVEIYWEVCNAGARPGDTLVLRMEGMALAAKDLCGFGKSDPYLTFKRLLPDGKTRNILTTEVTFLNVIVKMFVRR